MTEVSRLRACTPPRAAAYICSTANGIACTSLQAPGAALALPRSLSSCDPDDLAAMLKVHPRPRRRLCMRFTCDSRVEATRRHGRVSGGHAIAGGRPASLKRLVYTMHGTRSLGREFGTASSRRGFPPPTGAACEAACPSGAADACGAGTCHRDATRVSRGACGSVCGARWTGTAVPANKDMRASGTPAYTPLLTKTCAPQVHLREMDEAIFPLSLNETLLNLEDERQQRQHSRQGNNPPSSRHATAPDTRDPAITHGARPPGGDYGSAPNTGAQAQAAAEPAEIHSQEQAAAVLGLIPAWNRRVLQRLVRTLAVVAAAPGVKMDEGSVAISMAPCLSRSSQHDAAVSVTAGVSVTMGVSMLMRHAAAVAAILQALIRNQRLALASGDHQPLAHKPGAPERADGGRQRAEGRADPPPMPAAPQTLTPPAVSAGGAPPVVANADAVAHTGGAREGEGSGGGMRQAKFEPLVTYTLHGSSFDVGVRAGGVGGAGCEGDAGRMLLGKDEAGRAPTSPLIPFIVETEHEVRTSLLAHALSCRRSPLDSPRCRNCLRCTACHNARRLMPEAMAMCIICLRD